MSKLYFSKVEKKLNKVVLIAYLFHDIRWFSNADTSHVFHIFKNVKDIYLNLEKLFLDQFASNLAS